SAILPLRFSGALVSDRLAAHALFDLRRQYRIGHRGGVGLHAGAGIGQPRGWTDLAPSARAVAGPVRRRRTLYCRLRPCVAAAVPLGGGLYGWCAAAADGTAGLRSRADSHDSDGRHAAAAGGASREALRECRPFGWHSVFRQHAWIGGGVLRGGARYDA